MRHALACLLLTVAAPVLAEGGRATPSAGPPAKSPLPRPTSLVWVAAHPDDEVLVAPLLGAWCGSGTRCTLLVATRGEAGACLLPRGCLPDVATVRSAEEGASSELFGARLVLLTYPDGGLDEAARNPATANTIEGYLAAEAPEIVITFDPRHGTTCHPDHRAIGSLALEAAARLATAPRVYLLETRLEIGLEPPSLRFSRAAPALRLDGAEPGPGGATGWDFLLADMARHPSQFDDAFLAAARGAPVESRAVYLAPAADALARPAASCP